MRDCGNGGIAPPHSLQKRANGSVGRGAKQLVHLQQFIHPTHIHSFDYHSPTVPILSIPQDGPKSSHPIIIFMFNMSKPTQSAPLSSMLLRFAGKLFPIPNDIYPDS